MNDEIQIPAELRFAALCGPVVMIDELQEWGVGQSGQAARVFAAGTKSSHLTVAGDIEALHAFALKIGMRRAWFQVPRTARGGVPHYDLTEKRRARAVKAGALVVSGRLQAQVRMICRGLGTLFELAQRATPPCRCVATPKPPDRQVTCKFCGTVYGKTRHECHAINCTVEVPERLLMCPMHWRMVPRPLQRAVLDTYVEGQEIRKDPTDAYMVAHRAAVAAVAAIERGPAQPATVGFVRPAMLLTAAELDANPWAACGQAAVAALLRRELAAIKHVFPPHPWCNLTQMRSALSSLGVTWRTGPIASWPPPRGLTMIEFLGPWSEPGLPIGAVLKRTHWIAVDQRQGDGALVFDVNVVGADQNGGWTDEVYWRDKVIDHLLDGIPRASGAWRIRHVIEVT